MPKTLYERGQFLKVPFMTGYTDMEEVLDLSSDEINESGVAPGHFESLLGDAVLNDLPVNKDNDSCPQNHQYLMDTVGFFYKPSAAELSSNSTSLRKRFMDFMTEKKYGAPTYMQASLISQYSTTYVYRFDLKPRTMAITNMLPDWVGMPHKFDLIFIWGLPYWIALPDNAQWDSADKRVADIVMTLWANFAKYANPTKVGVYIKWDNFTQMSPGMLIIDSSFNMSDASTLNYKALEFWNDFFPKVVEMSTSCCNWTDNGTGRGIYTSYLTLTLSILLCVFITFLSIT